MADAYSKIGWENSPSEKTPINMTNLNHMDEGIEKNRELISQLEGQTADLSDTVEKNKKETDFILSNKIDGAYADDDGFLYLTSGGEVIVGPLGPFAGSTGGSSGSNNAAFDAANTTGWISTTKTDSEDCFVSFSWYSIEGDFATGKGLAVVKVNGITKLSKSVDQGEVSINLKDYLTAGQNTVRITVSDVYSNAKTLSFSIEVVKFGLTSSFDDTVAQTGNVTFPYVPTGNATKTMQFILDGTLIGSAEVTTSNRQQTFTIPVQSHGAHSFEVYFTAIINESTVESNHLHYDIIFTENGINNTVLASSFNVSSVAQYYSVSIPWIAYTPNSATTDVELYVNDELYSSLTVDRTKQIWTYRADNVGDLKLGIRAETAEPKVFNLTVVETDINVEAEENDLGLYLSSYGRSNNEVNPGVWTYGDISAQFQNFNFVSDGWQMDDEQNTVLRLSGDARLVIPYQIFAQDFRTTGKTIEFELATRNVLDYDAILLSCMSGGRGIEITTQMAGFKSEQSTIETKYKEEEHVRISFVVEKRNSTKLLICYINGKISRLSLYPDDDDFSQVLPVDITLGSNDCITDIYNIRVYDNDLTRYQMLDNWIADTQNGYEKKERYDRNNIYNDYGSVTIDTLKKDTPYMVIICPVLPSYKGDKKTCSGYFVDPNHPERNFSWEEAQIDVQGTSSQYYYIKNFKIKYKGGFILDDNTVLEVYQLKGVGVGTATFTMKADVASSEGWLNALLAQLYNELCPVKTPAQEDNPEVRQTIDAQPMVIFWNNGSDTQFYGKFNFNHDKGTPEVFGFEEGDESWEILQNGTDRVGFKSADFSGTDWQNDFEARYPEDNTDTTKLQAFSEWVASTNTDAATDAVLDEAVTYGEVEYTTDSKEYRLAKFVAELADWASVESLVFYYVFTFIFLCIDQREKNLFITWIARLMKWIALFYDADSSMGTDNKGNLAFDYWFEDIDYTEGGDPVFNGQGSVLWVNLRNGFWSEITAEYKRLRTTNDDSGNPLLSYDVVMNRILEHVNTWCEAIYNEDAYKKYIEPYVKNGDTSYLGMAFGDKVEWAKYWLYNRMRYLDSLFEVGTSMEKRIMFRARAKGNVTLMSYLNMYGRVYYNAETVVHRMFREQEYEFEWTATGAEDAVVGINDADMITSLGDLSKLMPEYVYLAEATHLGYLKVGDGAEDYSNPYLVTLGFGNNVLLRGVDARNCPNLSETIDMSGCTGLQEAYFTGTSITGLKLPNGCAIGTLHLPNTTANLTLRNLTKLADFQIEDSSNITTLWVENTSAVDSKSILENIASGSRVRLTGFDWTFDDAEELDTFVDVIDTMRGIDVNGNNTDVAELIGTITADNIYSKTLYFITQNYPNITLTYNNVIGYTVNFYSGDELIKTVENVQYMETVTYDGDTPVKDADDAEDWLFVGWSPELTYITGDTDYYAQFVYTNYISTKLINGEITGEYKHDTLTVLGSYAFGSCKKITSVSLPLVETIKRNAFSDCSGLTNLDVPAATTIGEGAFTSCTALTSVVFPSVTKIDPIFAFTGCTALVRIELPSITSIGRATFNECKALTTLILSNSENVCKLDATNAISTTPIADGTGYIYVPQALIEDYKVATNWATYADQFRAIEDYPDICGGE